MSASDNQVSLGEQKYASPEAFYGQLQLVFLNAKHCEFRQEHPLNL